MSLYRKLKLLLFVLIICGSGTIGFSQIVFQKEYGGSDYDYGIAVLQTDDGGYIVAGSTKSFGAGDWDIYAIRTDEFGDTLWTRTYGGPGADLAIAMIPTFDTCYIIAGRTESYGMGENDAYLLKININGDTIWTRTYGGPLGDYAHGLVQTSDNGLLVVGLTQNFGGSLASVYIVRTSESGEELWSRAYYKKQFSSGYSVVQASNGGFLIAGSTSVPYTLNTSDCYLIRIDASGDTLWTKTFGGAGDEGGWKIIQGVNGGYVVCGNTNSYGLGDKDLFLCKIDTLGASQWLRLYGGPDEEYFGTVSINDDQSYILTGTTESFGGGYAKIYLIKADTNGDTIWTRVFGKLGYLKQASEVQQTSDGGYIITGDINVSGELKNVVLIKTDENGYSGISLSAKRIFDLTIYPNPSNGVFRIRLKDDNNQHFSIKIYDLIGREIQFNCIKNNQFDDMIININNAKAGVYLIKISTTSEDYITKLLITKI